MNNEYVMLDDQELEQIAGAGYAARRYTSRLAEDAPAPNLPSPEVGQDNPDPSAGQDSSISVG